MVLGKNWLFNFLTNWCNVKVHTCSPCAICPVKIAICSKAKIHILGSMVANPDGFKRSHKKFVCSTVFCFLSINFFVQFDVSKSWHMWIGFQVCNPYITITNKSFAVYLCKKNSSRLSTSLPVLTDCQMWEVSSAAESFWLFRLPDSYLA